MGSSRNRGIIHTRCETVDTLQIVIKNTRYTLLASHLLAGSQVSTTHDMLFETHLVLIVTLFSVLTKVAQNLNESVVFEVKAAAIVVFSSHARSDALALHCPPSSAHTYLTYMRSIQVSPIPPPPSPSIQPTPSSTASNCCFHLPSLRSIPPNILTAIYKLPIPPSHTPPSNLSPTPQPITMPLAAPPKPPSPPLLPLPGSAIQSEPS